MIQKKSLPQGERGALSPNPVKLWGAKSASDQEVNEGRRHGHKPDDYRTALSVPAVGANGHCL